MPASSRTTRLDCSDWLRVTPFFAMHIGCLAAIWVGWSWVAVVVALFIYAVRVLFLTAFYHRYFAHRSFETFRWIQFPDLRFLDRFDFLSKLGLVWDLKAVPRAVLHQRLVKST